MKLPVSHDKVKIPSHRNVSLFLVERMAGTVLGLFRQSRECMAAPRQAATCGRVWSGCFGRVTGNSVEADMARETVAETRALKLRDVAKFFSS
jgi:hypothetical protein